MYGRVAESPDAELHICCHKLAFTLVPCSSDQVRRHDHSTAHAANQLLQRYVAPSLRVGLLLEYRSLQGVLLQVQAVLCGHTASTHSGAKHCSW